MNILQLAREAANRLGRDTTYEKIVEAIKSYRGKDRIGFALGLTSYLNDRKVNLPLLDTRKYNLLNQKIVKIWKQSR